MSEVKAKKAGLLTIEKELLSSYMEAVADMKKLLNNLVQNLAGDKELIENVEYEFQQVLDKHVDRIKSSGIWE